MTWFVNSLNWGLQLWTVWFVAAELQPVFYILLTSLPAAVLIFLISLHPRLGVGGYTKIDIICLLCLPIALSAWLLSGNVFLGILGAMAIEYLAVLPTMFKLKKAPFAENLTAWAVTSFTNFINLFAVSEFHLSVVFYALANFSRVPSMAIMIYRNQRNHPYMIERILLRARELTNADGGTLYVMSDNDQRLSFAMVHSGTLGLSLGGTSGRPIEFPSLPLNHEDGSENLNNVATAAAINRQTLNFADVYNETKFDFSGTRVFDQRNNYRTKSILTIPLLDLDARVVGVVQLINAMETDENGQTKVVSFTDEQAKIVERMGQDAAEALTLQIKLRQQGNPLKQAILLFKLGFGFQKRKNIGHLFTRLS